MKAHTLDTQSTITPQKALDFLKEGNQRFVNNLKMNRNLLEQVNDTRAGQFPFAVILSCIDSRTSAELIFDQGLGDIFSVRIAGNFSNEDILGSMEFACKVAGSKLILVLGHSKCGALKGGLDSESVDSLGLKNLSKLVHHFDSCINEVIKDGEEKSSSNADLLDRLTLKNIEHTIRDIRTNSSVLHEMEKSGEIIIAGANYDVETGEVKFLEN
jgi:carbonic anhydrase